MIKAVTITVLIKNKIPNSRLSTKGQSVGFSLRFIFGRHLSNYINSR